MAKLYGPAVFILCALIAVLSAIARDVSAFSPPVAPTLQPTPVAGHIATETELQKARDEWSHSRHANTFDDGQGANTTCASCKSPRNWDPTAVAAQDQALDCSACKRVAGAPRPALEGGLTIPQEEWHNIGCEICHVPVGNSFLKSIAFWNQVQGQYEPVETVTELCARCHEGTHGFQVIEEQAASQAHKNWDCTRCHGAHGASSACTTCHNPAVGKGAPEHARHPGTNCTACHDAGGLAIWQDLDSGSRHFKETVPVRFAHALRSWTSHDLQTAVDCRRCHHPRPDGSGLVAARVVCADCHTDGAVLFWCTNFPRNPDPNDVPASLPGTR